jgi:phage gpG-like protein
MISFSIDESSQRQLEQYLSTLGPRVTLEVHRALKDLLLRTATTGVQKYFAGSGPKGGPTTSLLTSRSGTLLQSIADAAENGIDPPSPGDGTTAITLQLSSTLPYARIQEYGGVAGRATFKKPNGRRPFLPPRPYLQPAFDEMQAALPDIVQEAVEKALGS